MHPESGTDAPSRPRIPSRSPIFPQPCSYVRLMAARFAEHGQCILRIGLFGWTTILNDHFTCAKRSPLDRRSQSPRTVPASKRNISAGFLGHTAWRKSFLNRFGNSPVKLVYFPCPTARTEKKERGRKRLSYFRRNDVFARKVYQCRKDEGFIRLPESWHSILDMGPVQAVNRSLAKDTAIATWVTLKRTKDAHFLFGNGLGLSEDRIEEIYRSKRLFLLSADLSDTLFSCLDDPDTEILSGVKRG